jgi:hypothetical protein
MSVCYASTIDMSRRGEQTNGVVINVP